MILVQEVQLLTLDQRNVIARLGNTGSLRVVNHAQKTLSALQDQHLANHVQQILHPLQDRWFVTAHLDFIWTQESAKPAQPTLTAQQAEHLAPNARLTATLHQAHHSVTVLQVIIST